MEQTQRRELRAACKAFAPHLLAIVAYVREQDLGWLANEIDDVWLSIGECLEDDDDN